MLLSNVAGAERPTRARIYLGWFRVSTECAGSRSKNFGGHGRLRALGGHDHVHVPVAVVRVPVTLDVPS
jgi:hypothetical protein